MTKADNTYLVIALAEMEKTFERQLASFEVIKTTVRALLSSASLIVALVSALQIFASPIFSPGWLICYRIGLLLAGCLYVALISLCSKALWPVAPVLPLACEWDVLTTAYRDLSEHDRLSKQLSAVLNAIDLNRPLIKRYVMFSMAATALLPLIVVILLLLALIPRI